MTENNVELNTASGECENDISEQDSHHSHSHHSHSHHSHSHHSSSHHDSSHHDSSHHDSSHHDSSHHDSSHHDSSHHDSSHHSHSHHSSSGHRHSSRKTESSKEFSLTNFLKQKSLGRMFKSVPQSRKISQRVLFCILFFGFIFVAITGIINQEETPTASKPGYARSEADQLKGQITTLQLEKAELEQELNRYKEIYGELEPEQSEN